MTEWGTVGNRQRPNTDDTLHLSRVTLQIFSGLFSTARRRGTDPGFEETTDNRTYPLELTELYIYKFGERDTNMTTRYDPSRVTGPSALAMQWLVLAVAYFILLLFLIGVFDLCLGLWDLITSGEFTEPTAVVELLNTVLLLLILVEVHRTLIAYARDEPVLQIVVGAAIIAVSREIISFRIEEFSTVADGLIAAGGFGILLLGLGLTYPVVWYTESKLEYRDS